MRIENEKDFKMATRFTIQDLDSHLFFPDNLSRKLNFENGRLWTLEESEIEVKMDKLKRYL
ncbi:MAG: hypothetical protein KGY66_01940 [Candidatus Thermoplasmatota archaeon]|nr:hypothetical protein [Candidatus Thermoplasmatota archaeon]MBS3789658.1 hypothetical protein [Candidatus Thermoplasmatota archaeon]